MRDSRSATLAEVVADSLRQALHDGVYQCGERLVELSIARDMHVSQNTARDALRILEQDGWVVKHPRYGVYVRTFSHDAALELYTLRGALERLALEWAMAEMSPANTLFLRHTLLAEAHMQTEIGNAYATREALLLFHNTIIRLAQKPQTADLLRRMHNQCRLLENLREAHMPRSNSEWREVLSQYRTLTEQIEQGQRRDARVTLYDLIMEDCHSLLPVVDMVPPGPA